MRQMPRRRRGGGSNQTGQIVLAVVLSLVLLALVAGLIWMVMKARNEYVPRDQASLCPVAGYRSQTLVLIDTTDALAAVTQTQVLEKLEDLVAGIPNDGLLEIRLLNADPEESNAILKLCNPGDGSGIDPMTGNPELARQRWESGFSDKTQEALKEAVIGHEQDFSPILETIQRIAAERLTSQSDRAIPSRLVVVSDMIQHTDRYSHFRNGTSFEVFETLARDRLATDLAQADVEFWLVRRDIQRIQPEALGAFWLKWAEANNSKRPATLTPLMGM
jgi:hypothetical protein